MEVGPSLLGNDENDALVPKEESLKELLSLQKRNALKIIFEHGC